jgi:hypothetical protein
LRRDGAAAAAALAFAGCAAAPPADVHLPDLEGRAHAPLAVHDVPAHVLVFLLPDCPIANAYAPEIAAIRRAYESTGIRFFLIYAQPDLDVGAARAHAASFGHHGPILIDRGHDLVRATGVTVTPEVAVLTRCGGIAYRGRIDDLFADVGTRRHRARTHDLRDALAAVVAGRPVAVARTEAVGCFLSDAAATDARR